MKKSFKKEIFLILCILLVSLFACVFDTSDDDTSQDLSKLSFEKKGAISLIGNNINLIDSLGISNNFFPVGNSAYNLGCYFRLKNSGNANLTNVPVKIYLTKADGTKIIDYYSTTISVPANSYFPSSSTEKICAGDSVSTTLSTTNFTIGNKYYLIFSISNGTQVVDTLTANGTA